VLHIVTLFLAFEEFCLRRIRDGFRSDVDAAIESKAVRRDIEAGAPNTTSQRADVTSVAVDVRWDVQRLRKEIARITGVEAVDPADFADVPEDHWIFAEQVLKRVSEPHLSQDPPDVKDRFRARELFPPKSLLLFHYDMELSSNEGALARGLHCKALVRNAQRLFEHRISDGDAVVMVILTN
jgi:hypothetical protein